MTAAITLAEAFVFAFSGLTRTATTTDALRRTSVANRCEALSHPWGPTPRQCSNVGLGIRDGHPVCGHHRLSDLIQFVPTEVSA